MIKRDAKTHRSVRRTQRDLRNSLIELMKEKPILRISAKEIYEAADIGRTTFYAHYKDQYDLLEEIETETITQLEELFNRYVDSVKHKKKNILDLTMEALNYIADNGSPLQVLLSENGNLLFQKKFFSQYITRLQKIMQNKSANQEDAYLYEGYSIYTVHGSIGLIQYWLKNKMHIPTPTLAKMLNNLRKDILP